MNVTQKQCMLNILNVVMVQTEVLTVANQLKNITIFYPVLVQITRVISML